MSPTRSPVLTRLNSGYAPGHPKDIIIEDVLKKACLLPPLRPRSLPPFSSMMPAMPAPFEKGKKATTITTMEFLAGLRPSVGRLAEFQGYSCLQLQLGPFLLFFFPIHDCRRDPALLHLLELARAGWRGKPWVIGFVQRYTPTQLCPNPVLHLPSIRRILQ